jgi:hypothetical protein
MATKSAGKAVAGKATVKAAVVQNAAPAKLKPVPMSVAEVQDFLTKNGCKGSTVAGKSEDGTRIHVWYGAFRAPAAMAIQEAKIAEDLGIDRQRYTGKLDRVWKSGAGDLIVTVLVELERGHKYRAFNVNKGEIYKMAVLGS